MGRFYGVIGYGESVETRPGIAEDVVVERTYHGNVLRNSKKSDGDSKVNEDFSMANSISVVADAYLEENFLNIRYIQWMGTRWKVSSIEVKRPRLILRLGGVYNGKTPPPASTP